MVKRPGFFLQLGTARWRRSLLAAWLLVVFSFSGPWVHRHQQQLFHDHGSGIIHSHWGHSSSAEAAWNVPDPEQEAHFFDALLIPSHSIDPPAVSAQRAALQQHWPVFRQERLLEPKVHGPPQRGCFFLRSPPLS